MKSKNKRIVRYKRPININIGLIIFVFIFLYIVTSSLLYITRDKISIYEVAKGTSENIAGISTTGLAMRNEQITNAVASGYINYYVKEGSRVCVGNTIYTIDESGNFSKMLEDAAQNDTTLTNENITEIRNDITKFISNYNGIDFDNVYEFKYNLNSTLLESVNLNALQNINDTLQQSGNTAISINGANQSGIIEFYTDGLENLTTDQLSDKNFKTDEYKKNYISAGSLIENNTPIYKTVCDEDWQIAIQMTKEQADAYKDQTVVNIKFPTEGLSTAANFSIIQNDNSYFGIITMKRYMIKFADKRYINLQIMGDCTDGLKVPKSSIIQKKFYSIPSEYLSTGGDSTTSGFYKEVVDAAGNSSIQFVTPEIFCTKDDVCYIDDSTLKSGDVLVKQDSDSKYKIEKTEKLDGVYNVNTGYTTFKCVNILSEKNGYYIVQSGTKYGLQVYDQIVLDASLVKENQVIFK